MCIRDRLHPRAAGGLCLPGVRERGQPLDVPHLRLSRLRQVPRGPRAGALAADGPLLLPGTGDAACVGLRWCAPPSQCPPSAASTSSASEK
eukprot:2581963-Pyramimonas_sp.AAC.1